MNETLNFVFTFNEFATYVTKFIILLAYISFYFSILRIMYYIMTSFANLENGPLTHNQNSILKAERRPPIRSGVCQSDERD